MYHTTEDAFNNLENISDEMLEKVDLTFLLNHESGIDQIIANNFILNKIKKVSDVINNIDSGYYTSKKYLDVTPEIEAKIISEINTLCLLHAKIMKLQIDKTMRHNKKLYDEKIAENSNFYNKHHASYIKYYIEKKTHIFGNAVDKMNEFYLDLIHEITSNDKTILVPDLIKIFNDKKIKSYTDLKIKYLKIMEMIKTSENKNF